MDSKMRTTTIIQAILKRQPQNEVNPQNENNVKNDDDQKQ